MQPIIKVNALKVYATKKFVLYYSDENIKICGGAKHVNKTIDMRVLFHSDREKKVEPVDGKHLNIIETATPEDSKKKELSGKNLRNLIESDPRYNARHGGRTIESEGKNN